MDFEDFEGFKRIKNEKGLDLEEIFSLLEPFKNEIGKLKIEETSIIADVNGKYYIIISLSGNEIILERHLEEGHIKDDDLSVDSAIELSQTNRMIEQIYDLLNEYMKNDTITEYITSSKKVLYMREERKTTILDFMISRKMFIVEDENAKIISEVQENNLMNEFEIKNPETKRQEWIVKYEKYKSDKYTLLKQPFYKIDISRNESKVKNIFEGIFEGKKIKISADYTDNHYLVELDEIVIGSIDCMDPIIKKEYRIEINNLEYEYLIIAIAVMADTFLEKIYMESNDKIVENIKDNISNFTDKAKDFFNKDNKI